MVTLAPLLFWRTCYLPAGGWRRAEVLDLLTRQYLPLNMYEAHKELAKVCPQPYPGIRKNSQTITAGEAYAIDLYNNLF